MVYGEHDYQRREEFILRRVRAGRLRIPFGAGTWLPTRGYVRDVARAVRMAPATPAAAGEVFNIAERRTSTVRLWARFGRKTGRENRWPGDPAARKRRGPQHAHLTVRT